MTLYRVIGHAVANKVKPHTCNCGYCQGGPGEPRGVHKFDVDIVVAADTKEAAFCKALISCSEREDLLLPNRYSLEDEEWEDDPVLGDVPEDQQLRHLGQPELFDTDDASRCPVCGGVHKAPSFSCPYVSVQPHRR